MQYNNMEISGQTEPPLQSPQPEAILIPPSSEQVGSPSQQNEELTTTTIVEELSDGIREGYTPLPKQVKDYRQIGELANMISAMGNTNPPTEPEHIAVQSEPKMTVLQKIGHLLKNLFTFWRKKGITPQLPSSLPEAS